jgi:hypothetical protein
MIDILEQILSQQDTGVFLLRCGPTMSCLYSSETGVELLSFLSAGRGAAPADFGAALREQDYLTLANSALRCADTFCSDGFPIRRKDGLWLFIRLFPVCKETAGGVLLLATIVRAPESEEFLEKALREKKLDLMRNNAHSLSFDYDAVTQRVNFSDRFLLLYDVCDPLSQPSVETILNSGCVSKDSYSVCQTALQEIRQRKPSGSVSIRLRSRLTASFFRVTVFWRTIFDDHGKAVRIVGILKPARGSKRADDEAMISNLQLQLELQDAYLRHTSDYLHELRRYRHDRSNHIIALKAFLMRGDTCSALSYLNAMGEALKSEVPIIDTGNPSVDAVVTEKLTIAKKLGVSVTHTVGLQPNLQIDAMDLTLAAGSCLDNAVEACGGVIAAGRPAFIELKFVEQRGALVFHLRNSSLPQTASDDALPETTKTDRENHGFGLRNVQKIVRKYGGKMSLSGGQSEFTTSFTLFLP